MVHDNTIANTVKNVSLKVDLLFLEKIFCFFFQNATSKYKQPERTQIINSYLFFFSFCFFPGVSVGSVFQKLKQNSFNVTSNHGNNQTSVTE